MRKLLSMLRILTFVALAAFLVTRFVFSQEPPSWLAFAYPVVLLVSLLYHRRHLLEAIFMDDFSVILPRDTRRSMRLWNIWHFRNYRDSYTTLGDRLAAWILRLAVIAVGVMIIVAVGSVALNRQV